MEVRGKRRLYLRIIKQFHSISKCDTKQVIHEQEQAIHEEKQVIHEGAQVIHERKQVIHESKQVIYEGKQVIHKVDKLYMREIGFLCAKSVV